MSSDDEVKAWFAKTEELRAKLETERAGLVARLTEVDRALLAMSSALEPSKPAPSPFTRQQAQALEILAASAPPLPVRRQAFDVSSGFAVAGGASIVEDEAAPDEHQLRPLG